VAFNNGNNGENSNDWWNNYILRKYKEYDLAYNSSI
jgi:hypothetical protein